MFGTKCGQCLQSFGKTDFVMRAKNKLFHVDCFRCVVCNVALRPGDEFALRDDGLLYCKLDNESQERASSPPCVDDGSPGSVGNGSTTPNSSIAAAASNNNNNSSSAINNNAPNGREGKDSDATVTTTKRQNGEWGCKRVRALLWYVCRWGGGMCLSVCLLVSVAMCVRLCLPGWQ